MIIGFTGTQLGMTFYQRRKIREQLQLMKPTEAHHGDCIGADQDFHILCRELNIPVVIHPPNIDAKRAFCEGEEVREVKQPKPYLDRNHDIVDASDIILATPAEAHEITRSGTWATIRYARRVGKSPLIFSPVES
jgi:hypothetical protein